MDKITYLIFVSVFMISINVFGNDNNSRPDTLIFTHKLHKEKYKIDKCEQCHVDILKSKRARDDNYADDQSCHTSGCHDIKRQDSCFVCHTNANGLAVKKPVREIKNSHKKHAKEKIECTVCHTYIEKQAYYTREELPAMSLCIECHADKKLNNKCEFCHTDPVLVNSHNSSWKHEHEDLFNQNSKKCEVCHSQDQCNRCHEGKLAEGMHPGNYLHIHQFDIFNSQDECQMCHNISGSCDGCHAKSWGGSKIDHRKMIDNSTSCRTCHSK